jgi:hypothetical protein
MMPIRQKLEAQCAAGAHSAPQAIGTSTLSSKATAAPHPSTSITHLHLCAGINGKWQALLDGAHRRRAMEQKRHLLKSIDFVNKHCPPKELRRLAIGILRGKYGMRHDEYKEQPTVDIANKRRRQNSKDMGTQTDAAAEPGHRKLQRRDSDSSSSMPDLPPLRLTSPYVPNVKALQNVVIDLTDDNASSKLDEWRLHRNRIDLKDYRQLAAADV